MPQLDAGTFFLQTHIPYYFVFVFHLIFYRIFIHKIIAPFRLRDYFYNDMFLGTKEIFFCGMFMYFINSAFYTVFFKTITKLSDHVIKISIINTINIIRSYQKEHFSPAYIYTLKKVVFLKKILD